MPKKKSLADELADLFNPAPTKGAAPLPPRLPPLPPAGGVKSAAPLNPFQSLPPLPRLKSTIRKRMCLAPGQPWRKATMSWLRSRRGAGAAGRPPVAAPPPLLAHFPATSSPSILPFGSKIAQAWGAERWQPAREEALVAAGPAREASPLARFARLPCPAGGSAAIL